VYLGVCTRRFVYPTYVNIDGIAEILFKFIVIDLSSFGVKEGTIECCWNKQITVAKSKAAILQLNSVSIARATGGYSQHFR